MSESMIAVSGGGEELSDALDARQVTVLETVRAGGSFVQAAKQAGVSRSTVYRWLQREPHFRAAFNAWQQELTESSRARLLAMSEQAVEVVQAALGRGDERVAIQMLCKLGVLREGKRGATDPQVLRLQMELDHFRQRDRANEALGQHLMRKRGPVAAEIESEGAWDLPAPPRGGTERAGDRQKPVQKSQTPEKPDELRRSELQSMDFGALAQELAGPILQEMLEDGLEQ